MCVERIQRLMMVAVLGVVLWAIMTQAFGLAAALVVFMMVMITVWAILDFCPSIWVLNKFLKTCKKG